MQLNEILEMVCKLQSKYPKLHVGGSIGLLLHGIDLGRKDYTDIDFCIDEDLFHSELEKNFNSGNDFEYVKDVNGVKYEIRVDPFQSFVKCGLYNVSELNTIVKYKQIYANRGYQKHIDDLEVIYKHIGKPVLEEILDDLPF